MNRDELAVLAEHALSLVPNETATDDLLSTLAALVEQTEEYISRAEIAASSARIRHWGLEAAANDELFIQRYNELRDTLVEAVGMLGIEVTAE